MATEINVPVKLQIQNLQSLVGELEKKLGNLKVGSSGFKNIQSLINSIRGEIDKLQVQTSKPFMDASQFTKAEHSVERLEDQIEKVGISLSRIKFSDLELTSGQKADLKAFEDQINSIKEKLRVVKSTAKDEFLNSAMGQEWLKIDDTAFSKSLSQITNNIRKAVQDQKTELEKLEEVAKSYQKALSENERIKDFTNKMIDDPANGSDLFSKKWQELTKTLANGKVQFQAGGKNLMVQWLESQLKIDSSVLHSLLSKSVTASNIGQELKKLLNEQLAKNEKVIQSNPNVEANVEALKAKYEGLLNILRQVGVSEQQVAQVEAVLRQELGETSQKTQEYQDNLVNAARANTDVASTSNAMKSQLESLRGTLQQTNAQFIQMQRTQQSFNQMKMAVVNFMGFNQVLNLTKNAIRNAINHIQELDSVMNKISIVTDMSTADLWNQVDAYSKMAQAYGVSIKGAYEVSQIYYQQGLQTNDVLTLTNETLKLARISGLDYAQTTDYMTTALRGFKMEMSEASTVVDVYSNLASHTAVSQEELAVAMSKTASSMEGVGATFEEASAMIATMVAVTRESATNIGSAMKSIASRYGELTKDPMKLIDDEGEVMSFNKVDAALQSVGISMKTADGQFREFTDVIIELGEKWNELESVQQRYIATQFAGNRQQSRFLALVSNVDLLKSNLDYAENSEDTGTLQALKALDSIEAKIEQVRVAYQQFYTTVGIEDAWKGFLDGTKIVIDTLNRMPKLFDKIPIAAINAIGSIITLIKSLGISLLSNLAQTLGMGFAKGIAMGEPEAKSATEQVMNTIISTAKNKTGEMEQTGRQLVMALNKGLDTQVFARRTGDKVNNTNVSNWYERAVATNNLSADAQSRAWAELAKDMSSAGVLTSEGFNIIKRGGQDAINIIERLRAAILGEGNAAEETKGKFTTWLSQHQKGIHNVMAFGSALNIVATAIDTTTQGGKKLSSTFMAVGGAITTVASIASAAATHFKTIPWVALASGIISIISGIKQYISANSIEAQLEEFTKKAEELSNKAKQLNSDYKTIDNGIKKLKELEQARYDSAEAAEEYQEQVNKLGESFPQLISSFDEAGNVVLNATLMENTLTEARQAAAEAAYAAAMAEKQKAETELNGKTNTAKEQGKKLVELSQKVNRGEFASDAIPIASYYTDENKNTSRNIYTSDRAILLQNLMNLQSSENATDNDLLLLEWLSENEQLKNSNDAEIIKTLISELGTNIENQNYAQAGFFNTLLRTAYYNIDGWNMSRDVREMVDEAEKLLTEITPLTNTITSANKTAVAQWIKTSNYSELPFLSESNGLLDLLQNELYSQANGDFSKTNLNAVGFKLFKPLDTLWNTLSDDLQQQVDTILSNPSNYTASDLEQVLNKAHIDSFLIPDWIYNTLNESNIRIKENLENKLNQIYDENNRSDNKYDELFELINDTNTEFTLKEQAFLVEGLNQIADINESGFDSTILENSIYNLLTSIQTLGKEARNALLTQILTNGFSTEGWNKTLNYIKTNTDFDFSTISSSDIEDIIKEEIPNYKLIAVSAISSVEESWEDLNKFFSNLSKGVDYTEVSGLVTQADSLGLDLYETDFVSDGEKWVLNANKVETLIKDYQDNLKLSINNSLKDLTDTFDLLDESDISMFSGDTSGQLNKDFIENNLQNYKRILGSDFEKYFKKDKNGRWFAILEEGESLVEAEERLWQDLKVHYTESSDSLNSVLLYYTNLFQSLSNTFKWKTGDYSSLDKIFEEVGLEENLFDILIDPKKLINYIDYPDIQSAFDMASSAYGNLISDVLNKGFSNINLSDYEGLIKDHINLSDVTSYQQFVLDYAKYANKTVQEINDLLVQAIQKDQSKVSADILKDLTFINRDTFTTSLEGLKELANVFEITAEDFNKWIQDYYDTATEKATVSVSELASKYNIDLTSVHTFNETVQEAIDSLFSGLISDVQKALEGKIDAKGVTQLRETLSALGLGSTQLDFTRTTEGIKMTEDSFFSLYNNLKKVNSLAAKQLIPAIKNMSNSYKTLIDAQKEWQKAREAENNEKASAIADVIADYLRTSSDAYNWTKGSMPLEWSKANELYTTAYNSRKTIYEASQKHFMGASDFYNQMSLLQAQSPDVEIGGHTAEWWLDNAGSFFGLDASGNFGIDFRKAGLDITDIYAWINAMIEAADKLREQGLVYERLVDDLNKSSKDKTINWKTILANYGEVDNEALQKAVNGSEDLQKGLEKISIKGQSLLDLVQNNEETILPQKALYQLLQHYREGNFTVEELTEQLAEAFGINSDSIRVEVTDTGEVYIDYVLDDKGNIIPSLKVGNTVLSGSDLAEYKRILENETAKVIEESDTGFTMVCDVEGNEILIEYNVNSGFTYTDKEHGIIAYSEQDLIDILTALGLNESENAEEPKSSLNQVKKTIVSGVEYEIEIDGTGTVTVKSTSGEADSKVVEQLKEFYTTKVQNEAQEAANAAADETPDAPIEMPAAKVLVNVTDETEVALNKSMLKLSKSLDLVTGETNKFRVDPKEVISSKKELTNPINEMSGDVNTLSINATSITTDVNGKKPTPSGTLQPLDYDTLDAAIKIVNAIYENKKPNQDKVSLTQIDYPLLEAAITEVQASYNGPTKTDDITITQSLYTKQVGIVLASLLLTRGARAQIQSNITIGDNELSIYDLVNAMLEGKVKLSSNGATVDDTSVVTLADGSEVKLPKGTQVGALIAQVLLKGTNVTTDDSGITYADGYDKIDFGAVYSIVSQILLKGTDVTTTDGGINYAEGADTIPFGDLIGLVTQLILNWLDPEASHEPDYEKDLGILTKYQAPDATVTQHIDVKYEWSFTGEGDILNQEATKIREMLENSGFTFYGNGTTFMYQLEEGAIAEEIVKAINSYTEKGGTRYEIKDGWVIEAVTDLDTEEVEVTLKATTLDISAIEDEADINDLISKEPVKVPIELEPNGNVNLNNRPYISPELMKKAGWLDFDGDYATLFSNTMTSSVESEIQVTVGVTPITEDGQVLSPEALDSYVYDYLFGNGTNTVEDIIELDKKGLNILIDIQEGSSQEDIEAMNNKLIAIHEEQEQIYNDPLLPEIDSSELDELIITLTSILNLINTISSSQVNLNTSGDGTATGNALAEGNILNGDNIALAAGRKTLMGELGPEMYVSHGHYYIAGQGGAEMVDLPEDAIVFNHIQTRSLLKNGKATRGKAVVNERIATGMAHASGFDNKDLTKLNKSYNTGITNVSVLQKDAQIWNGAANKLIEAAEIQIEAAEKQSEATKEIKKTANVNSNHLHTGYIRAATIDGKSTQTSVSNGYYTNTSKSTGNLPLSQDVGSMLNQNRFYAQNGSATTKDAEEYAKQVQSVISKLLEVGFEAINLDSSEFEKLDKTLKAEMKQYIAQADASYREFVRMYGEAAHLTVSEFNTQYFDAWQKDLGNTGEAQEIREAAKNLNFFAGGSIGGSAEDWVTLFGDYTAVTDLVKAGIIDWNEDLQQYIVTSIEALQQFNTNLDITEFQDIIADSLRATSKAMTDLISKAESGEITYSEFNELNAYLDQNKLGQISRDALTQTANGLVVNYKTLANLYAEAVNKNLDKETLNTLRNIKDTRLTNINNALQSGMGGSMKWEELDNLQSLLDDYDDKIAIKFTQTTEGLKLSTDTLIHFYNLLQKVDGIQAHLNFKRLNETLKENNTHYRSATTILARIKDLQDAINNSERYNDEKIRQYQEELSLAEEILAVRATSEDDSFDFINQKLPGGMNNPLTYMNAVAEGWREFRDATKEDGSGIIDYQKFYNMANEANNVAKITGQAFDFLGYTLDGGIENLSELMTKASLSLHFSEDGSKFGVSLAEFGNSLVDGADSFSVSTDQMVHAMAESQIKVLDGLIAMFEMIVAMESFEGADLDMDGLLDLDEIFDLSGLTEDMYNTATNFTEEFRKGAQQFVAVMESDKQFEELAESIKLNGYSLAELVRDAADDGVKNLAISVEMFQQGLSVLYEALKNGDYNPQDIYNSLKEFLLTNESGYTDTFQLNDMIIDLKYGAEVKVTDEGYKAAGQTFDNQNDAIQAAILAKQGVKDIQVVEGEASGTLAVGKLNMTVTSVDKNVIYNGQYSTLDDAIKAQYETAKANGETTLKLEEWKIKQEITVVPVVNANLKESALELDQDQINAAIGKSYEDIKAEWEAAQGSEESTLEFEATYGIQLNENTTEEDWARFKELAGIETKNIELNVAINVVNSDDVLGKLLGANGGNVGVGAKTEDAEKSTEKLQSDINNMDAMITVDVNDQATSVIDSIDKALDDLDKREVTPTIKADDQTGLDTAASASNMDGEAGAAGTVSGAAMASGTQTLMGELGPELYVSNGRYHLAGQNGAEFVNLPDDAIVFNHLQTQKLLATGSAGRGKPITNERNAVAMAHGTEGPAAASAKEILAQLKQMRAMWQSLANISVKEMAGVGGSEGGGETAKNTSWLAQVERWYDLLQKIARLEKEINYQEALRNKLESDRVPNGKEYFDTQVQSLDNLKQQALAHKELAESQEDYFNQRRKELNERKSPFAKFYTFDEGGQLKYQPGAFDKLSDIVAQDEWGKPKYTPQQQYDLMKSYGFESYMKYDSSGNPIDQSQEGWQLQAVQAVWERMEAEQKEMQTLYDSKEEQKVKYLDSINDANKLLQQMVDNQIDLEKQVISAIEEREQAVIDALSDERQALADSTNAYIKGLQDSLDKERKMREKNDSDLELSKLQSRLSMLQRGGGSAAEIANLQREISDKQTDMYFDAQSQQIEAIQDASDLQLEKLQTQIDLMSESLAYAKENGLLWAEATEIMKQNPEVIAQFITDNSPDFASQSVAAQTEELRKILFSAEQFASYYDYIESLKEGKTPLDSTLFDLNTAINDGFEIVVANDENKEKQAYEEQKKQREEEAQRWEVEQEQRKADEKAQQNAAAVAHENEMYNLYGAALGMSRQTWDQQRAKGRITDESLQEKYDIDGITQRIQELQMDMYQEMQRNKDNPQYSYWSNQQMGKVQDQIKALEALRDKLRFKAYAKEQGYTKRYAHGGLVNYTGLAMVHGSDARPEAFLNADEVKVWKEDILGSSSHSLTSQMLEMQSLYEKFNSTISSTYHNNSEGINIERVDVNMNVAQLANDYDARRAGREMMNEILNIANKSSSGNRVGR